jgi:hypothetical protein
MTTITVGLRMPQGLQLRLGPDLVKVNGTAKPALNYGQQPGPGTVKVVYGYALTPGIDAELFAAWLKSNADSDIVRRGLIFGVPDIEADGEAVRRARGGRSGLDQVTPTPAA